MIFRIITIYKKLKVNTLSFFANFSYVFLIPKMNFTIPLKCFGTFFTTIVIVFPPYLSNIFLIPVMINAIEMIHNHAIGGKIKISSIPSPIPRTKPANILFHLHDFLKNIFYTSLLILYEFYQNYVNKKIDLFFYLCYDIIEKEVDKNGKNDCKKSYC